MSSNLLKRRSILLVALGLAATPALALIPKLQVSGQANPPRTAPMATAHLGPQGSPDAWRG